MVRPQAGVFVQVVRRHVLKVQNAPVRHGDQFPVDGQGRRSGRQAQHAARIVHNLSRDQDRRRNGSQIPVGIDTYVHGHTSFCLSIC